MPREREELFRESNSIEKEKIVVLAFEGNLTEKIYFEEFRASENFNDDLIYLHLLSRLPSDTNSAPNHVFNKLKREAKDEYNLSSTDELWMVIDTDKWKNIEEIAQECKKQGNMFLAVSNPCFELWLLLHVKRIEEYTPEELELLLKNDKTGAKRRYVETKIIEVLGSYNKSNPRADLFLVGLEQAVAQARSLNSQDEDFPTSLGSFVYKIVENIMR